MSFETKLLKRCDHRIIEEDHVVDIDGVTVYLDLTVSSFDNIITRVNGIPLDKRNTIELLYEEDTTSQVTGSNSIFVVSKIPVYDGSNKGRIASRLVDVVVQVSVFDEDASAQFTGTDVLLVTQHRPLMSAFNINAIQLTDKDVEVKVDDGGGPVVVEIESIEPTFGKITLKEPPASTDIVTVSYHYRAHVDAINGGSGSITIREVPEIGHEVYISYYYMEKDGWNVQYNETTKSSSIIFDRRKTTNVVLVQDEDVSSQFIGVENSFYTEHKPMIPPRSKLKTEPIETLVTQIAVLVNGQRVTPLNFNAEKGYVLLGFKPAATDVVTISYHYRNEIPADIISIDYHVSINSCRKCKRTGQLNDFSYEIGELVTVVREEKMLQDLLKLVTAIRGSNAAHTWYGTSLVSFIGTAHLPEYYQIKFRGEIIDAGDRMKDLQQQQTQYQTVDDEEFFSFLDNISVEQSDIDPNFYEIEAIVVSQAATSIQLNTSLMFSQPLFGTS